MKETSGSKEKLHKTFSSFSETAIKKENFDNVNQVHKRVKIKKRVRRNKSVTNKISQTSVAVESVESAKSLSKLNSFEKIKFKKRVRKSLTKLQSFSGLSVKSDPVDKENVGNLDFLPNEKIYYGEATTPEPCYKSNPDIPSILISSHHLRKSLSVAALQDRDKKRIRFSESNSYHPICKKKRSGSKQFKSTKQQTLPSIAETNKDSAEVSNLPRQSSKGSHRVKVKKTRIVRKKSKTSNNDQSVKTAELSNGLNSTDQKNVEIFDVKEPRNSNSLPNKKDIDKISSNDDLNLQILPKQNNLDKYEATKSVSNTKVSLENEVNKSTSEIFTIYTASELKNNNEQNIVSNDSSIKNYQHGSIQNDEKRNLQETEGKTNNNSINDANNKNINTKLLSESEFKNFEEKKNSFKTGGASIETNFNKRVEENEGFHSTELKQTQNLNEIPAHNSIVINEKTSLEISISDISPNRKSESSIEHEEKLPKDSESENKNQTTLIKEKPNRDSPASFHNNNTDESKKVSPNPRMFSDLTKDLSMKIKDCCKNYNNVVKNDQSKNFNDKQHQDNKPVALVNSSVSLPESCNSFDDGKNLVVNSYKDQVKSKLIKISKQVEKVEIDINLLKTESNKSQKINSDLRYNSQCHNNKEVQLLKYSFLFCNQRKKVYEESSNEIGQKIGKSAKNFERLCNTNFSGNYETSKNKTAKNLFKNFSKWRSFKFSENKAPTKMKSFDDNFIEYFSCSKLREPTIKQTNSDCSLVTTASSTDKLSLFIC